MSNFELLILKIVLVQWRLKGCDEMMSEDVKYCFVYIMFNYINYCRLLIFWSLEIVLVHEDGNGDRSGHEIISEDEKRRRRMRSLRKKAMNPSTRTMRELRKRGQRKVHCLFASVCNEEFLDKEEEIVINAFRRALVERDMLLPHYDDYHTMLRWLSD